MSVAKRVLSGSVASWMQIGVTVISQLVLVPLYLTYWDVATYGVWISVQALVTLLTMLSFGHQSFLGFEFLRLGINNRQQLGLQFWSGIWAAFFIGVVELGVMLLLHFTGILHFLLSDAAVLDQLLVKEAGLVLAIQGFVWMLTGSMGGVLVRLMAVFNYFPRLAWWGVLLAFITALAPALAVMMGGGLLSAGLFLGIATLLYNGFLFLDIYHLMRKEGITYTHPSIKTAWQNVVRSLALFIKNLLENCRIGGVRILLAPLAGNQALVSFSTIRTGANFVMQGLNTIMHPMMPELMRFLHQRDQARSETAFGTIWIIIIALMAPGVVILQTFIAPFFELWTKGKVVFDPVLFALLSTGVLLYAAAQPAIAIVMGNNLLKVQLKLSALAATVVIGVMLALVPALGIVGAGIALLLAELMVTIGYKMTAKKWLAENGLCWPRQSAKRVYVAIVLASVSLAMLIAFPAAQYYTFAGSMCLLCLNLAKYWQTLPVFTRNRTKELLRSVPLMKKWVTA